MATNPTDSKILQSGFISLPPNIKDWLSSEELSYIIGEINSKIGISGEKEIIIPKLILRLVVQDLDPLNFVEELAKELGIKFEVAKTIAKDIESQTLKPIEDDLRKNLGLDLKVIYFGKPGGKPREEAPAQEEKSTPKDSEIYIPKEPTVAPTQKDGKLTQTEQVSEPKVDLKTFEEISPFMLHQEKSEPGQRIPSEAGPRINIKTSVGQAPTREESKPISVKLESPRADNVPPPAKPVNTQGTRVVHYHQFKTPLNNLGLPKQDQ